MNVAAHLYGAHVSAQKVRLLRQMLIGLPVKEARAQLMFAKGKSAQLLQGVLGSAVANAKHNHSLEEHLLVVADVAAQEGTRLKRHRAASRGMAHPYQRRSAHITVVVRDVGATSTQSGSKKKTAITTLSVEELTKHTKLEQRVTEKSVDNETISDEKHVGKELEAYQKIKARQRGGDRKKAFRRKSV